MVAQGRWLGQLRGDGYGSSGEMVRIAQGSWFGQLRGDS